MRLRVLEWKPAKIASAGRANALLRDAEAVPLEERDVLGRPRPLRLETEQERAGGRGQFDRRPDQRVDDFDVGRIGGGPARHEAEPAIRPGLEHQHLQGADDPVAAQRRDPRRRRLQVGLQLTPLPRLEDVAVRRGFDEGVPGVAFGARHQGQRVAHRARTAYAVAGTASFFETPRVSPQKSP
jgi:hypothetical protein